MAPLKPIKRIGKVDLPRLGSKQGFFISLSPDQLITPT